MTTVSVHGNYNTKATKRIRVPNESRGNLQETAAGTTPSRNTLNNRWKHLPSLNTHKNPNFVCHVQREEQCPGSTFPGKNAEVHPQDSNFPPLNSGTNTLCSVSLNAEPAVKGRVEELERLEEGFRLPPLPHGSLTFQHVIKDLHFYDRCDYLSSSDDSSCSNDENDGGRTRRRKLKKRCKLEWYGPIVEYKGHHIYLSTLTCLQVKVLPFVKPRWC